ncbi:sarcosine oxidase subunit beta family protein [Belnapia sp. T6]|uniref:Sarcosine oxidase subunit beta family protein n=1 Tax=Belnapia mucosa TaxID=2804532 RepID=A0ABS1UY95_9PROT|nr:sarcosine oxidase subunit beta family protein [Belnapia mucosa]MBL6454272.1 sarcosine oxidase subunit beta family protein [Belnapia mucosa]
MLRYSAFRIAAEGLRGNRGWTPTWRKAKPKPRYDVIVIGGGGHGLATAFYLAEVHGIRNVAVLERGLIGQGNTGRNTTIVRSNYLLPENNRFYEHSLKLWEGLEQSLGYNVMMSQRGVVNLFHNDAQRNAAIRRGNSMRLSGIDAELVDREGVRALCPLVDLDNSRYPVMGGLLQRRGGTARHDAVAWGFAHAADARGVDIIEHCEVTGLLIEGGAIGGVQTTRGEIRAPKVGLAVAGHTTTLTDMAGFPLPIETHLLQAFVSEGLKPLIDCVVTFGAGHFYISQSDKGGLVFGGGLDGYNSYGQRGTLREAEHVFAAGLSMIPALGRLRALRSWAGVMDMTPDGSPFICKTPVHGLYMTAGWCYGGFKATPGSGWCHAWTIAKDEPHPLNAAFTLERFREGRALDERGNGPYPWAQ